MNGPIDFSLNLPSPSHADHALAQTLGELSKSQNLASFLDYQFTGDHDHHLAVAANWLCKIGLNAPSHASSVFPCLVINARKICIAKLFVWKLKGGRKGSDRAGVRNQII